MDSSSNLTSLPEESFGEEEQLQHQSKETSSAASSAFSSIPNRPPIKASSHKYSPIGWLGYFDQEDDIHIPDSNDVNGSFFWLFGLPVFHLYKAGSGGPVVFCLHGGGYCGLSFALAASKIKEKARVVAMDLRGHGKSSTENELDLSIETLCDDVVAVLNTMYGDTPPAIVLVGHSMGGSVAIQVAAKKALSSLSGLVVVDVVEGTAMASLIHMQKILSSRMQYFSTIEKAIEWSVRGGSLRNIESARVSIPGTLKYDDSKKCWKKRSSIGEAEAFWVSITIASAANFWVEMKKCYWYEGLSEKFLSCPAPKLLLLAGTDRLDRYQGFADHHSGFHLRTPRPCRTYRLLLAISTLTPGPDTRLLFAFSSSRGGFLCLASAMGSRVEVEEQRGTQLARGDDGE
ncbi:hypothetical protein C3L33_16259, partial [Rhododendron williamsianum]